MSMIRALLRLLAALAVAALAALPLPALACSVTDDYRVPTNLELAEGAQLVLLAKVTGGVKGEGPVSSSITLHPLSALKGELPSADIVLKGVTLLPDERFLVLSDPYQFAQAHPLSYIGGCIRYMFPLGTTALFFLERKDGEWQPSAGAFSRWAEDVPGADAPWVTLTALYVKAAALPEAERKALLKGEQAELAAKQDDPLAQLMAADIARQLAGPNEPWNVLMAREMQRMGFGGEDEGEQSGSAVDGALDAMRAPPSGD